MVVLLHGWPAGPSVFRRLVPLVASRFRVLVPDMSEDADLADQAATVGELLDGVAADDWVVTAGHGRLQAGQPQAVRVIELGKAGGPRGAASAPRNAASGAGRAGGASGPGVGGASGPAGRPQA